MATAASALVKGVLDEYGAVTRDGLAHYLGQGEPRRHLYDLVADYPRRGGRSLRASICIAAARAFGGVTEEAADSAVALEILHNAFLVHDDIEDESELRRGQPTMHRLHGVPVAVNVGDALAVLSLGPLISNFRKLGPGRALRVLEEAERMARESVEGQAVELGWRRDNTFSLSVDAYLHMILKKTCWYTTIYPARVGAMIGGADEVDLERITRFGFFLGAAFQIQDDLLNLLGDPEKYGKELGGDLCEGKRTVMLIRLIEVATAPQRRRLQRILAGGRHSRAVADVRWMRALMDTHGCIEFARQFAHGLAGAARHEARLAFGRLPDSRDRRFLEALPLWVLERA